jgi:hypothetical protein
VLAETVLILAVAPAVENLASTSVRLATMLVADATALFAGLETNVAVETAMLMPVPAVSTTFAALSWIVTALPTIGAAVTVPRVVVMAPFAAVACAGTTDKSPNPSEATATADTFFNEIVFTIFLSFSRSQAFPGLGWWLKRPPH